MRYLLSWLGLDDLRASEAAVARKEGRKPVHDRVRGPLFEALNNVDKLGADTRVVLLNHNDEAAADAFKKNVAATNVGIRQIHLKTIFDYRDIHDAAVNAVEVIQKTDKGAQLSFFLNSGTPPMQTVWILLGKTRFQADLVAWGTREGRLETIEIPFQITAAFVRERTSIALRNSSLDPVEGPSGFDGIVGRCPRILEVVKRARVAAELNVPVVLEGESGTGKELFARAIHDASPRRKRPFIAVNCGAIPESLIEAELFGSVKGAFTGAVDRDGHFVEAKGGTLFLDEIGELPLPAQVRLLRPLQENQVVPVGRSSPIKVDVRVIAATHRNLVKEVAERRFREDLFFRLAVAVLRIPALRERDGDVQLLVDHLMPKINENLRETHKPRRLSADACALLSTYEWPGNVRELSNTLWRAALWSPKEELGQDEIRSAMLMPETKPLGATLPLGYRLKDTIKDVESKAILQALTQAGGKKKAAAALLGISHQSLAVRRRRLKMEG